MEPLLCTGLTSCWPESLSVIILTTGHALVSSIPSVPPTDPPLPFSPSHLCDCTWGGGRRQNWPWKAGINVTRRMLCEPQSAAAVGWLPSDILLGNKTNRNRSLNSFPQGQLFFCQELRKDSFPESSAAGLVFAMSSSNL